MYPRYIEQRVREALTDTRVVLLCGPRQSGKTTLARRIAGDTFPFITLDDATTLSAALADPVGFLRGVDRAVVDEIQRAPNLILATAFAAGRRARGEEDLLLQLWVTLRAGALAASSSSSPSIPFSRRFTMTGARRTGGDLCRCRVVPAHVTREKNDDTAASAHDQ